MSKRIQPIADIGFRKMESDSVRYVEDRLEVYRTPVKCMKIIDKRYKVYVDYGFKGNSRYADDQSDFYVVDVQEDNAILKPSSNDYGSIVATLEKKADRERPLSAFVSDAKVLVLTMAQMVADGWEFEQEANGDILATNDATSEKKRLSDDSKLKQWILNQSLNY